MARTIDLDIELPVIVTPSAPQVQADWNQNDDTQPDFINNRICYEKEETFRSYSDTDTDYEVIGEWNFYPVPDIDENFVQTFVGRTVSFRVDDEDYDSWSAVLRYAEHGWTPGDLYKWDETTYAVYGEWDYDFIVFVLEDNTDVYGTTLNKGIAVLNYLSGDISYDISATRTTIKKLNEKFIPDEIARLSNIPTNLRNGSGNYSIEGNHHCEASGKWTFAFGDSTYAIGEHSIAVGRSITTRAKWSAGFGDWNATSDNANCSFVTGYGSHANARSQFVFGEFNKEDNIVDQQSKKGEFIEIVGNGVYPIRSNARTLDWSGNENIAGMLRIGSSSSTGGVLLKFESNSLKVSFDNGATWGTVQITF